MYIVSELPAGVQSIGTVGLDAGTNAIGKLAANSGVDIGDVDVLSAPVRSGTTDSIRMYDVTDIMMNSSGTSLTPKFAAIAAASSGDNTLVAAVAGKQIRITSLFFVTAGAVTVRFEDGAGGTALSGQMQFPANGGISLPYNPKGWFETSATTLLNMELSGAISVAGGLQYIEV